MRVIFIGVGEAFDDLLASTSILVESNSSSILLDCGFSTPLSFWKLAGKATDVDMIYVSHFHADHYFGIPALLARFIQENRKKRLTIMGPAGIEGHVTRLVEMGFANLMGKAKFETFFIECAPGDEFRNAGFNFSFAMTDHSMPCLAVRLETNGRALFYSGDGRPTDTSQALAKGCYLVIHEAYALCNDVPGHGTVCTAMRFASEAGAKVCALVHMDRVIRHDKKDMVKDCIARTPGLRGFLPEPGDVFIL